MVALNGVYYVEANERISKATTIGSDEVVVNGIASGGTARGHTDLAKDRREMGVDGARADDQLFRHLLVGHSLSHQAQHLDLSGCQPVGISR